MTFTNKTAIRRYSKHIAQTQSCLATWKPSDKLALGDVGVIRKGMFRKETSLEHLGVRFDPEEGQKQPSLNLSSVAGGSLTGNASTQYPGVDLGGQFEMSKAGTVLFEAKGVQHHRIDDQAGVTKMILELHEAGEWRRKWVLIDQVWTADLASIVISVSDDALISLEVDGRPIDGLAALRAGGEMSLNVLRGAVVDAVGAVNLTPMYTARKMNLFGADVAPTRDGREGERVDLIPVSLDDIVSSLDAPDE